MTTYMDTESDAAVNTLTSCPGPTEIIQVLYSVI